MMYERYRVEIEAADKLTRRVLTFTQLDLKVVLDADVDEARPSTRHKWRAVRTWQRIASRLREGEWMAWLFRSTSPRDSHEALSAIRQRLTLEAALLPGDGS